MARHPTRPVRIVAVVLAAVAAAVAIGLSVSSVDGPAPAQQLADYDTSPK